MSKLWIAILVFLCLAGCSEELYPVVAPTSTVRGRVMLDGRPVTGGWIEFIPVDGAVGHHRTGPIGADGRYEVSGVAVGPNLVGISRSSADLVLVSPTLSVGKILGGFGSPLRRTIASTPQSTVDLDLRAALREISKNESQGR